VTGPAGKVRWEEMLPDELLAAIRERPVCYLAYGLAEPHGAYNAIGLDWLKAQALLERAARAHGGVVAPPFAWHVQEQPHFDWTGHMGVRQPLCSSIPADLFLRTVLHQIRAVDARGFRAAILVTGHYGGLENDLRLLCDFYLRLTGSPLRLRAGADWEFIRFEDYRGDHAGGCETSQLLALRPELVDLARKEGESASGPWAGTDFPDKRGRTPSREIGEKIVASQVKRLGEVARELLGAEVKGSGPFISWRAPDMTATDEIWRRFERATRRYWWMSTTLEQWKAGEKAPAFPGWAAVGE
jgi:creatinine amidohydrolase